jgi:hypothetical protein
MNESAAPAPAVVTTLATADPAGRVTVCCRGAAAVFTRPGPAMAARR